MSAPANVTSIDAVKRFRTSLQSFEAETRDTLTDLVLEVRRALDWIEVDRARYWPREARRAYERAVEARVNLERCQLSITGEDRKSCFAEKKELERAKRRLRIAEEKVHVVQRWAMKVRHEVEEFEGQVAKLNNTLDTQTPRAVAALQRMIKSLDEQVTELEIRQQAGESIAFEAPDPIFAGRCAGDDATVPSEALTRLVIEAEIAAGLESIEGDLRMAIQVELMNTGRGREVLEADPEALTEGGVRSDPKTPASRRSASGSFVPSANSARADHTHAGSSRRMDAPPQRLSPMSRRPL